MRVRPFVREAGWELPSSLDGLIAADHPVRFIASYVDGLSDADWQALGITLLKADKVGNSGGGSCLRRIVHSLMAILHTQDCAPEALCQPDSARALARGYIEHRLARSQVDGCAKVFG